MTTIWLLLFSYAIGVFVGWVIWGEEEEYEHIVPEADEWQQEREEMARMPEHHATDEEIRFHNERTK